MLKALKLSKGQFQRHKSGTNHSSYHIKAKLKATLELISSHEQYEDYVLNLYKKLELFGTSVPTSQDCLQKISERYLIQNQRYAFV